MDMTEKRGQRLLTISREAIPMFLTDSPAYETDAPEDLELEELWHHEDGFGYVLRLSSTEWEPVEEGEIIPDVEFTIEEQWED